jgi:hypothetical protein
MVTGVPGFNPKDPPRAPSPSRRGVSRPLRSVDHPFAVRAHLVPKPMDGFGWSAELWPSDGYRQQCAFVGRSAVKTDLLQADIDSDVRLHRLAKDGPLRTWRAAAAAA